MQLTASIRRIIEETLSTTIQQVTALSGGDINIAALLHTSKGDFFIKMNDSPHTVAMLEAEAKGLKILSQSNSIPVAEVLSMGKSGSVAWLLLDYIASGNPSDDFWEYFGHSLANLHRQTHTHFGLDHSNFIGSLPQFNKPEPDWVSFFINQRLQPQLKMAINSGQLNNKDNKHFNLLYKKLPELVPEEPPALTHGDLWSGNFICSEEGQAILIDPAVSYAHREMDLAMSSLFGGFAPRFYSAYQESYPTAPGLEKRMGIYQLYYLLVHVNLFGGGYVNQVRAVLARQA